MIIKTFRATRATEDINTFENYDSVKAVIARFRDCERAVMLIRQLHGLVNVVQRHRGVSMALLANQYDYRDEFVALQAQIDRRLAALDAYTFSVDLLTDSDKKNLVNAWMTIRSNWENDDVTDNFELHSHFVGNLLRTIEYVGSALNSSLGLSLSTEQQLRMSRLLSYACSRLPQTLEEVARIRGSTSYMVAMGSGHGFDENKIRFWITGLRKHLQSLVIEAKDLAEFSAWYEQSVPLIEKNDAAIPLLLDVIESVAFSGFPSNEGSERIFARASEVIDNYFVVLNHCLDQVVRSNLQELDSYMETGISPEN